MTEIKYKIYPSSSGFSQGTGIVTDYNNGCLRYVVASIGAIRKDLDPIYGQLGLIHEDWWAAQLGSQLAEREQPVQKMLTENIQYSGRVDFKTVSGEIHETKASLSPSFLYQVIRKGKIKIGHLAQLVSYIIHHKSTKGKLIAGYYKLDIVDTKQVFTLKEHRIFDINIDTDGKIMVDNYNSGFTIQDQLGHLYQTVKALQEQTIGARPINHIEFMGPCMFCPLKSLCTTYDKSFITDEEFKTQGLILINGQEPKKYKIKEKPSGRKRNTRNSRNATKSIFAGR